ncbi:nucleolar complex protein 14 [Phlyctochytrium bullatum]|nr:nucleolar complex protein 14 [Phlyctochytrium bullatum]
MEEIIAKSKMHKFERQQQNEDNRKLTEEVDADLDMIRNILGGMRDDAASKPAADDYDKHVKEMISEIRSKPSNRTKSEEELALERKAKLEELERQRLERMMSMGDSNSKKARKPQADDLGDDLEEEEEEDTIEFTPDGLYVPSAGRKSDSTSSADAPEIATKPLSQSSGIPASSDLDKILADNGIPFVIPFPNTSKDFSALLKEHPPDVQSVIIDRLRLLYSEKLGEANKIRMQSPADWSSGAKSAEALMRHIFELCVVFPDIAGNMFKEELNQWNETLSVTAPENLKTAISMKHVFVLKAIGAIYSASDIAHPLCTPAMNIMCHFLALCPASAGRLTAFGLYICSILSEWQSDSKRYVPEVIYFLSNVLSLNAKKLKTGITGLDQRSLLDICSLKKVSAVDPKEICFTLISEASSISARFARLYGSLPAFIEIFTPIQSSMENAATMHESIKEVLEQPLNTIASIMNPWKLRRKPLAILQIKKVAIETYAPKFDANYSLDRKQEFSKERVKVKKMQKEYKREFKGALRELRKDGKFIAKKRLEERIEEADRYKKRMNAIIGELANQEGAMRGMEKMKKKLR